MNVLFVTHAFPRTAGDAAGSFILRLAHSLRPHGVTPTVVAPHAAGLPRRETVAGVDVRRVRYAPERYETLAYTGTMAEQVRSSWGARIALGGLVAATVAAVDRRRSQVGADVLHAHWWFPSGVAAAAVATLRAVPLVTTLHGSDVRLARGTPGAARLYEQVARRSRVVTAVSTWLASQAAALAPRLRAPIVAPMPADVDLFTPGGTRAAERLLFVGRLTTQKGLDVLLRAAALLPATVSLDVVGDGPERESLRELAGALGIADRVRWHPATTQANLVQHYRAATALVVPSTDEGLGLVAVEAHLCETPVVAFDSGGLRDVVVGGETGLLVRGADARALAASLSDLLTRADRGAALGREGRARALQRFAPEAVARRYMAIYEEALHHRRDHEG